MKHRIDKKSWIQAGFLLICVIALAILAKHYEYPDIQVGHVEELVIPGVEGEYEFLFLTDLHMAIKTREDAGPYGDAQERINAFSNAKGTISARQFPQWISYANEQKVDAVLMGGDMIDYYSEENAAYLAGYIKQLEMPYVFTLGNHELFSPWKEEIPQDSVIYELFSDKTGAFQMLEYEEFVICAIDNEVYQVNEASLTEMKSWLSQNGEKPVILLAHVPFYTEKNKSLLETTLSVWGQALVIGTGEGTRDTTTVSREFIELVFGKESPVVAVFVGDNHFYHRGNLTDSVVQWVGAPAYAGNGMIIKVRGK